MWGGGGSPPALDDSEGWGSRLCVGHNEGCSVVIGEEDAQVLIGFAAFPSFGW